ncbi:hypothetical protein EDB83DRAFT_2322270 [Lactarius deliciosus]|nr:hypothetical protein EDB83DRAFT_2322270 [Lactarius deliciosus]
MTYYITLDVKIWDIGEGKTTYHARIMEGFERDEPNREETHGMVRSVRVSVRGRPDVRFATCGPDDRLADPLYNIHKKVQNVITNKASLTDLFHHHPRVIDGRKKVAKRYAPDRLDRTIPTALSSIGQSVSIMVGVTGQAGQAQLSIALLTLILRALMPRFTNSESLLCPTVSSYVPIIASTHSWPSSERLMGDQILVVTLKYRPSLRSIGKSLLIREDRDNDSKINATAEGVVKWLQKAAFSLTEHPDDTPTGDDLKVIKVLLWQAQE